VFVSHTLVQTQHTPNLIPNLPHSHAQTSVRAHSQWKKAPRDPHRHCSTPPTITITAIPIPTFATSFPHLHPLPSDTPLALHPISPPHLTIHHNPPRSHHHRLTPNALLVLHTPSQLSTRAPHSNLKPHITRLRRFRAPDPTSPGRKSRPCHLGAPRHISWPQHMLPWNKPAVAGLGRGEATTRTRGGSRVCKRRYKCTWTQKQAQKHMQTRPSTLLLTLRTC
jgi:hypothetical protein